MKFREKGRTMNVPMRHWGRFYLKKNGSKSDASKKVDKEIATPEKYVMKLKGTNNADLGDILDEAMQLEHTGFPIEIFPKAVQNLIKNANETIGFNPDYFSAGLLSAAATSIGNSVTLDNGSYVSKPALWLTIIGQKGTGKTHPLQFAKAPIEKRDSIAFETYREQWKEYEQSEKDKKVKRPKYAKFILNDFTPEKLADALQYSEKGILIFKDELMHWINSFDQYKKGGDQQMYLELFNGSELTVDRISREPIRVERTNVNILGGMQPKLLKGMAKNNRADDGFLDRFLFVYPDNLKPKLFTGLSIAKNHRENYERLIANLLEAPIQTIKVDDENIELFKDWQHDKATQSFNDYLESGIQSKLETYVWRLALVLEMMHQATTGNYHNRLQQGNLKNAIVLVEYFRLNALKVHDRILDKNPLVDLTAKQRDLYDSLPQQFKRIDVLPLFIEKDVPVRSGDRLLKNAHLFYNSNTHKELKFGQYKKKFS